MVVNWQMENASPVRAILYKDKKSCKKKPWIKTKWSLLIRIFFPLNPEIFTDNYRMDFPLSEYQRYLREIKIIFKKFGIVKKSLILLV